MLTRNAPAIKWGDGLENTLVAGWPLRDAITSRPPLPGYETVQSPGGEEDAWVPGGRGEYELAGELGFVDLVDRTSPVAQTGWSGATGVQAFLAWARDKRRFRFVPDKNVPDFWVDDCYLAAPIDDEPPQERDGTRRVPLVIRSPHMDFGWALRGLGIDFGPGSDLTDPPRGNFDRQTNNGRYHSLAGAVVAAGADVLRDRHYEGTVRTILAESFIQNYLLQSETWDVNDTPWARSNVTVTGNATASPDLAVTAEKLVETAVNSAHFITQAITITADEWIAASMYVKAGERFRLRFLVRDPTIGGSITMTVRLDTGVVVTSSATGTGTLVGARIVRLANGWFRLELEGRLGGGFTTAHYIVAIHDDADAESYLGDVAKGLYVWGGQLERSLSTAVKIPVGAYVPTVGSSAVKNADVLRWSWPWPIQASWFYLKFIEKGAALQANFNTLLRWGEDAGAIPQVRFITGSGSGGANPFWRFNWTHDGGTTQSAGIANVTPAIGDVVELYGRLFANGNVELHQAINGAAAAVFAGSGGQSLAGKAIIRRMKLFEAAPVGLIRCKAGFAPGVTTLAQARDV